MKTTPIPTGLFRCGHALRYALLGLKAAWTQEEAFRQEVVLLLLFLPLGLWLGQNGVERAVLVGSLLLVLIVEILNSAIEAAVDRFGPEYHPLVGRAKDLGAAAVLLAFLHAALVWGLVVFL